MTKILVADDSSTIQKVVRITLASEPYQLVECMDEDELLKIISVNQFDLVLLDFNLSTSKTGFQLGAEIKEKCPKAKILAMLGTFDSVDLDELQSAGIEDSIVKPFESDLFIRKCRELTSRDDSSDEFDDSFEGISGDIPRIIKENGVGITEDKEGTENIENMDDVDDLDNWTVNSPDISQSEISIPGKIVDHAIAKDKNILHKELEDWSMEVPSIIGGDSIIDDLILPPVIESNASNTSKVELEEIPDEISFEEIENFEDEVEGKSIDLDSTSTFDLKRYEEECNQALPEEDDLAYPDNSNVEEMSEEEILAVGESESFMDMRVDMVSLDDLSPEDSSKEFEGEIPLTQSKLEDLERGIAEDEVDDLWAVDEQESSSDLPDEEFDGGIEVNREVAEEVSHQVKTRWPLPVEDDEIEIDIDFDHGADLEQAPIVQPEIKIDTDVIVNQIKESLTPLIEKIVKEEINKRSIEIIERITWEVIPDLAENLIKKEIKTITDSID